MFKSTSGRPFSMIKNTGNCARDTVGDAVHWVQTTITNRVRLVRLRVLLERYNVMYAQRACNRFLYHFPFKVAHRASGLKFEKW